MAKRRVKAVAINQDASLIDYARAIASHAAKQRLPSAGSIEFADADVLMAYGVNFQEMARRAAYFIDRILRGAKASDLPVEHATKFELEIHLKSAKALGISVPQTLLQRADTVIQ